MIKRNFISRDCDMLMKLYKSLVRPHLDYCSQVWSPWLQKDIKLMEGVQRRFTKLIFNDKEYNERLILCNLTTLETRRLRNDLIETFKILGGLEVMNSLLELKE